MRCWHTVTIPVLDIDAPACAPPASQSMAMQQQTRTQSRNIRTVPMSQQVRAISVDAVPASAQKMRPSSRTQPDRSRDSQRRSAQKNNTCTQRWQTLTHCIPCYAGAGTCSFKAASVKVESNTTNDTCHVRVKLHRTLTKSGPTVALDALAPCRLSCVSCIASA